MWAVAGMKQNNHEKMDKQQEILKTKKVIVITGSIGTGKSAAVDILKKMGFSVLDSDKIVHEGYNKGTELYHKVVDIFGKEILNEDGTINRNILGSIVFNDTEKLDILDNLVHTYVREELMKGVENSSEQVIFLDIPLILETIDKNDSYNLKYDEVWLVYVSEQTQRNRLQKRALKEGKNPEDVLKIIGKQISIERKVSMSDEIIDNEGTLQELEDNIKKLLKIKDIRW
ncbi:MAG: coaE [Sedimentibacter sp.]|jgi:dephospho-CoA kinase|nr:coaE [Sedimentibacter sp.]